PVTEHANKTNAFGLADMSGNVDELCQDGWTDNYKKAPSDSSSQWGERFARILRGGSVGKSANYCRSAYRHSTVARAVWNGAGFRAFRSLN
ncbi:MAG: SUMF1/EgtB/PvdO family nonheme iron enzyme, partial [Planctomycetota bacterium]|nr:SUMF1/EgtB/PvdO family nonheme iron enzyme [Planctomycetota bacterium]